MPDRRAASTNSRWAMPTVTPRMLRAKNGMLTTATAYQGIDQTRPQHGNDRQREQDTRKGHQHIDTAHHQAIGAAAEVSGNDTDRRSDKGCQRAARRRRRRQAKAECPTPDGTEDRGQDGRCRATHRHRRREASGGWLGSVTSGIGERQDRGEQCDETDRSTSTVHRRRLPGDCAESASASACAASGLDPRVEPALRDIREQIEQRRSRPPPRSHRPARAICHGSKSPEPASGRHPAIGTRSRYRPHRRAQNLPARRSPE